MKKAFLFFVLAQFAITLHCQVIADHTVVELYDDIPQQWIDIVKTKWVSVTGASHATAYHRGLQELQNIDNNFTVLVQYSGTPNPDQNTALRSSGATYGSYSSPTGWNYILGRGDWWTNDIAVERIKDYLQYCNDNGPALFAHLYGWSFDANFDHEEGNGPVGTYDPLYHVRWAGSTIYGIDGDRAWGLDLDDAPLVNNRVSMSNYISSVEAYNQYCEDQNIPTTIVYTTGPVDDNDTQGWNINERGYQQYLKWEYIRDHVNTRSEAYFFDLADILSYNDSDVQATTIWTDNNSTLQTYPIIHPDNMTGDYVGHIGTVGALRLGKAMWWLLARMAGWDGSTGGLDTSPPTVPSGLTLNSVSQTSVSFSWDASSDNTGVSEYRIYRQGNLHGTTTELFYTDNTVSSCTDYTYTVTALDAAENESAPSSILYVNTCSPDVTPTLTVSPNIIHGTNNFNLIVRVTELNSVIINGSIIVYVPKDSKWSLFNGFDQSLTSLGSTNLNNSDWSYSEDLVNHIFTSISTFSAGGASTFGFTCTFDPGSSTGTNPITSQVANGVLGEVRVSNNSDSERLDYFQQ